MTAAINAPYLRTTHTWSCQKGHETIVKDAGWPQRASVRLAVQKAWKLHGDADELRCPVCGGKVLYSAPASPAVAPAPSVPVAPAVPWPDFQQYGRSYYLVPPSPGGSVEGRANAGKRIRR